MSINLIERQAIRDKAYQIADMVAQSQEIALFKQTEREMRSHAQVQELLAEMQALQASGQEVDALLDRLEQFEVVRRFTVAQEEVSEVVSRVTLILGATLSDRLDLVTEEEGCCGDCTLCSGAVASCTSVAACAEGQCQ